MRGVLHGAMALYLARYLNVPPDRLPGEGGDGSMIFPPTSGAIRTALLELSIASGRSIWSAAWSRAISRSATRPMR